MAVNENFKPLMLYWRGMPPTYADCGKNPDTRKCFLAPESGTSPPSAKHIALYHYVTKSKEDFAAKQIRGSGMSKKIKDDRFFKKVTRIQSDAEWCKVPLELAKQCCQKLYN